MPKIYFTEEQKLSGPAFWIFLVVVYSVMLVPLIMELYSARNKGYSIGPALISILILLSFFVGISILIKTIKLITEVRQDGIYYRYLPFIRSFRRIGKDEIADFTLREYKPIREYGGWGIKVGLFRSGRAYNVIGNKGMQLYLKNGKKVLFGTQRGEVFQRAMQKMMKEE